MKNITVHFQHKENTDYLSTNIPHPVFSYCNVGGMRALTLHQNMKMEGCKTKTTHKKILKMLSRTCVDHLWVILLFGLLIMNNTFHLYNHLIPCRDKQNKLVLCVFFFVFFHFAAKSLHAIDVEEEQMLDTRGIQPMSIQTQYPDDSMSNKNMSMLSSVSACYSKSCPCTYFSYRVLLTI